MTSRCCPSVARASSTCGAAASPGTRVFVAAQRISTLEGAREVATHLTAQFEAGELDRVEVIYHRFKNVATQVLTHEVMLPVQPAPVQAPALNPGDKELCFFEPSENALVGYLIARCVEIQLHRALLESQAAELCARMMAMDKADTRTPRSCSVS